MRTRWIHELRWPEVAAYLERSDIALIPIGATEQHGRHLPMLIDTGWAITASEYAAQSADVLIAPPCHFGWSPHHMEYPGTVTLGADTLKRVVVDVGLSLTYHRFSRLILVNGNRIANLSPLEIAAVEIANRTGAFVGIADVGLIAKREVAALCKTQDGYEHAGEIETAFGLHWASQHVAMDQISPKREKNISSSKFAYVMELDPTKSGNAINLAITPGEYRSSTAPDGITTDPSNATAEQGKQLVDAIGRNLVDFIEEVRKKPTNLLPKVLPL